MAQEVEDEAFGIHGAGLVLSEDKKTLSINSASNYTAYGTVQLPSTNNNRKYEWNFKVNQLLANDAKIAIGIQDIKIDKSYTSFYCHQTVSGLNMKRKMADFWGSQSEYDIAINLQIGSIITLSVDMKALTISIEIDDKEIISRRRIVSREDLIYRLAVTLMERETSISLTHFAITDCDCKEDEFDIDTADDVNANKIEIDQSLSIKEEKLESKLISKEQQIEELMASLKQKDKVLFFLKYFCYFRGFGLLNMFIVQLIERMKERESEQKESVCIGLESLTKSLDNELTVFESEFTAKSLRNIFAESPETIMDSDSALNRRLNKYRQNMDRLKQSVNALDAAVTSIESVVRELSVPNTAHYAQWTVNQMISWIKSLENGRFNDYVDALRKGFIEGQMNGEDLPSVEAKDLSDAPFNIKRFRDKKDLAKYFQSLSTDKEQGHDDEYENDVDIASAEGATTGFL